MSHPVLKNHWSLNCSFLLLWNSTDEAHWRKTVVMFPYTVCFRFELRSLPWIRLADITRFRTRNLNWIERSRLFCYSVINLLCRITFSFLSLSRAKAFIFYHTYFCLSRTFWFVFSFFWQKWNILFSFLRSNCCILSYSLYLSSTFLFFFCISAKKAKENTEKEGFEPSHRANGLHP